MGTPLHTTAALRQIETAAQANLPAGELMRRAGAAAARLVHDRQRDARVLVVCGPGNNGGDGYVCGVELRALDHRVTVVALAPPATDDARAAARRWAEAGGATVATVPAGEDFDVIVDAMFGIGMARPLAGVFLDAARWMSARRARVVAMDLPSGLDADRGAWVGDVAGVQAGATVTFLGAKPGLYTHDGIDAAGRVTIESLGVEPAPSMGALLEPADFVPVLAPRPRNSHKGTYGNALIVGGHVGMVGAALIAARAALRLGAGRVYVDCIGAPDLRFDPVQPELMFRRSSEVVPVDAIVIGCGLGADEGAAAALRFALLQPSPLVLDADALNRIAADGSLQQALHQHRAARVLTPHPLEAARLLGRSARQVQADRIASATELARRLASIVVLKGAGTVIAEPGGHWWINSTGSPALATAGTGDALAGMVGALIAQGFAPEVAARAATWLHGAAADEFGSDVGLVAGEIAPIAARLLSRLRRG
jgi:hydroxyethylthiazole kinase-like uncharacterized protein yjeF